MKQQHSVQGSSRPHKRDTCRLYCFNEKLVRRLRECLPETEAVENAKSVFAALGNGTRLLVLYCLAQAEELCVCDIANTLQMNLSTISHQLRHLRALGLVACRSEGKMAFYRLGSRRVSDLLRVELGGMDAPAQIRT